MINRKYLTSLILFARKQTLENGEKISEKYLTSKQMEHKINPYLDQNKCKLKIIIIKLLV